MKGKKESHGGVGIFTGKGVATTITKHLLFIRHYS